MSHQFDGQTIGQVQSLNENDEILENKNEEENKVIEEETCKSEHIFLNR